MTLIPTDEIRTSLITALKTNTTIMAELDDSNEVREYNWKGADFSYPNIRVQIRENTIEPSLSCGQRIFASIYSFSEENSSSQAEQIAGIIADEFHAKSLSASDLFFTQIIADIIPAVSVEVNTWRSEVTIRSWVQRSG